MKIRRTIVLSVLYIMAFTSFMLAGFIFLSNFEMFSTIAAKAAGVVARPTFTVMLQLTISMIVSVSSIALADYFCKLYKKTKKQKCKVIIFEANPADLSELHEFKKNG